VTDQAQRVRDLAAPLADARSLDLVDVAVKGSGSSRLVRVVVDRKGGVDLAACQELSRELSARLDEEDPIDGRYALEVTSPGTDHPLRDRAAFDRVEGRAVRVHRAGAGDVPVQVEGVVTRAEDDAVVLDVDGSAVRVPYTEIVTAKQTLPW
jgi:ribosome maturation factor RimP